MFVTLVVVKPDTGICASLLQFWNMACMVVAFDVLKPETFSVVMPVQL